MKISGHGSYLKVFDLIYVNKRIVPMHITTSFLMPDPPQFESKTDYNYISCHDCLDSIMKQVYRSRFTFHKILPQNRSNPLGPYHFQL